MVPSRHPRGDRKQISVSGLGTTGVEDVCLPGTVSVGVTDCAPPLILDVYGEALTLSQLHLELGLQGGMEVAEALRCGYPHSLFYPPPCPSLSLWDLHPKRGGRYLPRGSWLEAPQSTPGTKGHCNVPFKVGERSPLCCVYFTPVNTLIRSCVLGPSGSFPSWQGKGM